MVGGTLAALAFTPILLAGVLLVGFRLPAKYVMPFVYLVSCGIGLGVWGMSVNRVAASTLQGLILTASLLAAALRSSVKKIISVWKSSGFLRRRRTASTTKSASSSVSPGVSGRDRMRPAASSATGQLPSPCSWGS